MSIVIVLGGTFAASVITFGVGDLVRVFNIFFKVFFKEFINPQDAIKDIIDVSLRLEKNKAEIRNIINENKMHPFIIDGLKLLENDFDKDQVKTIMTSALVERKDYQMHQVQIIKTLAKYPPAFGMIGTVLGLVSVMQSLGGSSAIEEIGPNMAVALITTLYGLFFANYAFIPMSDNLLHRLDNEVRIRKLIIKGIMLIQDGQDPFFIQEMLNAHLLPNQRINNLASLAV